MTRFFPGLWTIACLLVLSGGVRADEEAATKDATPSPLSELREEHLAKETDPVDPIEYLRSFRDWIAQHEAAPPRTQHDTILYDTWNAALRPRASRMTRRIDNMMRRKYWIPEDGAAERVRPGVWRRFTREVASLMTELHGAWKAYAKARVRAPGMVSNVRPTYGYVGYGPCSTSMPRPA